MQTQVRDNQTPMHIYIYIYIHVHAVERSKEATYSSKKLKPHTVLKLI